MIEAQAIFDQYAMPACPEELTSPVLHRVLELRAAQAAHLGRQRGRLARRWYRAIYRPQRADQQAVIEIMKRDLACPLIR